MAVPISLSSPRPFSMPSSTPSCRFFEASYSARKAVAAPDWSQYPSASTRAGPGRPEEDGPAPPRPADATRLIAWASPAFPPFPPLPPSSPDRPARVGPPAATCTPSGTPATSVRAAPSWAWRAASWSGGRALMMPRLASSFWRAGKSVSRMAALARLEGGAGGVREERGPTAVSTPTPRVPPLPSASLSLSLLSSPDVRVQGRLGRPVRRRPDLIRFLVGGRWSVREAWAESEREACGACLLPPLFFLSPASAR